MIKIWTYIEKPEEHDIFLITKKRENNKTYYVLGYFVTSNVNNKIEYHTNSNTLLNLYLTIFKPRRARFINNTLQRLDYITVSNYDSLSYYFTKCCVLMNKLCGFWSKLKIDENCYICKF